MIGCKWIKVNNSWYIRPSPTSSTHHLKSFDIISIIRRLQQKNNNNGLTGEAILSNISKNFIVSGFRVRK